MLWNIIEYATTATESIICADFVVRFLKSKRTKNTVLCFCLISIFNILVTTVLNQIIIFEGALGFCRVFVNFIFSFFLLKGSIFEKILVSLISETILLISNFSLLSLISFIFNTPTTNLIQEHNYVRFLVLLFSKFLLFIFTRILIKLKNKDSYMFSFKEWTILSIVFALTIFLEMELTKFAVDNNISSDNIFIMMSCIIIIVIDILIYILMMQMSKKNTENTKLLIDKMQIELYKNQFAEIETKYDELRKVRHDMKNHLQCILALIDKNENEQAKNYISDIIGTKLEFACQFINTGNKVVDVIANTKLNDCRKENIRTVVKISRFSLDIDEIDTCIILSNLFDNAIEACKKIENERIIYFEISQRKSYGHL